MIGDKLLNLITETLEELDKPSLPLSSAIRKSTRIARLRNDYDNLWWLEQEMLPFDDEEAKMRLARELLAHYSKDEFKKRREKILDALISERKVRSIEDDGSISDNESVAGASIGEIEATIESLKGTLNEPPPPSGLHSLDLYYADKAYRQRLSISRLFLSEYEKIISRVRHRVHVFLSETEKQILYGQINADIFERNRQYVDQKLASIAPEVLEQLVLAYKRASEGNPEAGSQALLSCRRVLKSIADRVYPARDEPVKGKDGKDRRLTEEKYIARLWQFVADKVKGRSAGELVLARIEDIGNRIDRIYELASKGVHATVSDQEVDQCVIQTYLLIGDILRLEDNSSAIFNE